MLGVTRPASTRRFARFTANAIACQDRHRLCELVVVERDAVRTHSVTDDPSL